ncbi:MAG TPA: M20/M25/M40 family metallo-hydrolase [Bacteroidia bacterium]|nr:M20/M25/M40 family metallo-hydrolase [Bacteroidia bacterium]
MCLTKNRFTISAVLLACLCFQNISAQQSDSLMLRKIYNEILTNGKAYPWLYDLTTTIGARLSGSPQAEQSVEWTRKKMQEAGADSVWLQEVMVPHWVRGEKEKGTILQSNGAKQDVPVCALGMSIATPKEGLTAQIIEVRDFDDLKKLGEEKVKGKIVFYNHPFDQTFINTFQAYGEAGTYRWSGASEAARFGAVASITRSMTSSDNDFPHTGSMGYNDSLPKIPCAAISSNGANLLSRILKADANTKFFLKQSCDMLDSVLSHNVVGEIKGSEHPEEIIVVGGHLDSWDIGLGAHDDGAGIVQSIEVLRTMKALGIKPKRTIRAVAFMNEENGLRGGKKYAELAEKNNDKNIAAIESDAGGFVPVGFGLNMKEEQKKKIQSWKPLFLPYNVWNFEGGGDGADISPMTNKGLPGIGLRVESQRYFEIHHAATDVMENVNKRELHLGAAAMTSLIYLLSEYGL